MLGPLLLGGAGVALAAVGTVGLVRGDACTLSADDGACLDGREARVGVSAAYLGVGAAAVVGALVWHLAGGKPQRQKSKRLPLQVVPTAGGLGFSGRF